MIEKAFIQALADSKPNEPKEVAKKTTRIQQDREKRILDVAVELFAKHGERGTTLDEIANQVGMSKPNLLYYYKSKQEIYLAVLQRTLKIWLAPLQTLDPDKDPAEEIRRYIEAKVNFSFEYPLESKLYASEMIQGATYVMPIVDSVLKTIMLEKTEVLRQWVKQGKICDVDPYHLIFMIWAATQHYADFHNQVIALMPKDISEDDIRKQAIDTIATVILNGIIPPKA